MKVQIKSFNGIGDLLFVTPTLSKLKHKFPEVQVTVNTNYPQLLENNPHVDYVNTGKEGIFLGYDDPIHRKWPTAHHILKDWEIVSREAGLNIPKPELQPEIYTKTEPMPHFNELIGVQTIHKGHWHAKKVWPNFNEVALLPGFVAIPRFNSIQALVGAIRSFKAVICAEGGISHIAKAVGTPAIVIYGGFAKPEWNGYEDQINLCNEKHCSFCYNPGPCENEIDRLCMKEITMEKVLESTLSLNKMDSIENGTHNAKRFISSDAQLWCRGTGLDIGAGWNPLPGAIPIEDNDLENAYHLEKYQDVDYVFSSHCLEHLKWPVTALHEWVRVLKPGGILYLYLPHPDYIRWRVESMPKYHRTNFYHSTIMRLLRRVPNLEILEWVEKDPFFSRKIIARKI